MRHPIDERVSRVFLWCEFCDLTVQILRFDRLPRDGMILTDRDIRRRKIRWRFAEGFSAQAGKESRQTVVIVLAPAFVRVMVAFGTLQPQTEKDLSRVRGDLMQLIVAGLPEPVDGGGVGPFTAGGDDTTDEFIVRSVPGNHVLQPVVKGIRGPIGSGEVRISQDRSPLHREVGGIIRGFQQPIDQLIPFISSLFTKKRPRFVDGRQPATKIDRDPAKECGIITG